MSGLTPSMLAKLAALRAQKTEATTSVQTQPPQENQSALVTQTVVTPTTRLATNSNTSNSVSVGGNSGSTVSSPVHTPTQAPTSVVSTQASTGALRTTDINHMDFLSKLQDLQEKIHTQHPQMPILLRQIHKQLIEDPEIVTLVNEEALGIIVKGLQIQTKTELIQVALKESKTKAKKVALDIDMF